MSALESVDEKSVPRILDRLVVLNLCKEAMGEGVELRVIPNDVSKCSKIVKQMLGKMRPEMECQIRTYNVEYMRKYRMTIGRNQITMCPWSVQLMPIRLPQGSITISKAIKFAVPTILGNDMQTRIIRGPIGEFVRARGFSLVYRGASNTDIILFAAAMKPVDNENDIKEHVRIMRENLISPMDFCKAVALVYDEVRASHKLIERAEEDLKTDQAKLKEIFDAGQEVIKKRTEEAKEVIQAVAKMEEERKETKLVLPPPIVNGDLDDENNAVDLIRGSMEQMKVDKRRRFEESVAEILGRGGNGNG